MAYGFSLLYALSGSTRLSEIGIAIATRGARDPLLLLALATTGAGLLFKVAAVPFHMWAPDAYEGAPTPAAAYLAVASTAASIALLVRLLTGPLASGRALWEPALAAVAIATLTLGNLGAIGQNNLKRLLAYSSISHAGYLLLGLIAGNETGIKGISVYLITYVFMTVGAFAIVITVGENIGDLNGLAHRNPWSAFLMLVFLVSLAGLPPTAGFLGKYYLLQALVETGHYTAGRPGNAIRDRGALLLLPRGARNVYAGNRKRNTHSRRFRFAFCPCGQRASNPRYRRLSGTVPPLCGKQSGSMTWITIATTLVLVAGVPLIALYLQLVERKVLADFQVRMGPMRTGPYGLLQPIADVLKLALKEDLTPTHANRLMFWIAPVLATAAALAAFTVLPLSASIVVMDVNVGILVVSATAAFGVFGIIIGGWSSNSHYSLLGALRSAAQLVSYEVSFGFAMLSGLMVAGTLSLQGVVQAQLDRHIWFGFSNYGFMLIPFALFLISITAEGNRAPFDLPEAESELIGGYHTEYSGLRWSFFMLSEYANLLLASGVGVTLFLGGWLRPFANTPWLGWPLNSGAPLALGGYLAFQCVNMARRLRQRHQRLLLVGIAIALFLFGLLFLIPPVAARASGPFWFVLKLAVLIYGMIWIRGTFPRLRYDQLMRLGWKYLIPVGIMSLLVNAVLGLL